MSRVDEAIKRHAMGYNCCQAVACVFADEAGMDEAQLYKLCEGFGFGMGTMDGICGAMSGAAVIAGLLKSNGDLENPGTSKKETTKITGSMQREFIQRAKALLCRDIKTGNNGKAFTSCDDCIRIATEITEEFLGI